MTFPNFLVIGAAKSGTTALYHYLKQHPQIYMSIHKEPSFFGTIKGDIALEQANVATDPQKYSDVYFADVKDEIAIGEANPNTIYTRGAVKKIKHYIPDAKLIAILRNPVDRAYSHFLWHAYQPRCPYRDLFSGFEEIIRKDKERIRNDMPIQHQNFVQIGFYYSQLKRYFDVFSKTQIRIYLYEDFVNNPLDMLQGIFRFLEVSDSFVPDMSMKYSMSGIHRNKIVHNLLLILGHFLPPTVHHRIRRKLNERYIFSTERKLFKPTLPCNIRQELIELYREDILHLQDLIGRNLAKWLA